MDCLTRRRLSMALLARSSRRARKTWELERAKGLEPSTPTLARSCSTTELHPHPKVLAAIAVPTNGETYAKCPSLMQQFADTPKPAGSRILTAAAGSRGPESGRFLIKAPRGLRSPISLSPALDQE